MLGAAAIKECLVPHRRLVQARLQANLSQEALAALSGVSRATIGLIERFSHDVSADKKVKIANVFGLQVIDLWPEEIEPDQQPMGERSSCTESGS